MLATNGGTPQQLRLAGVELEAVRLHPAVNSKHHLYTPTDRTTASSPAVCRSLPVHGRINDDKYVRGDLSTDSSCVMRYQPECCVRSPTVCTVWRPSTSYVHDFSRRRWFDAECRSTRRRVALWSVATVATLTAVRGSKLLSRNENCFRRTSSG